MKAEVTPSGALKPLMAHGLHVMSMGFLVQLVSLGRSVLVSTPRDVSLADVRKGINMFKLEVPILGMVLNQAYYQRPTCVKPKKEYIFGTSLLSFLRFFPIRTDSF